MLSFSQFSHSLGRRHSEHSIGRLISSRKVSVSGLDWKEIELDIFNSIEEQILELGLGLGFSSKIVGSRLEFRKMKKIKAWRF